MKNSKIFLSPHSDDETLFGAYTIMKEKPLVIICTDSYLQGDNLLARRNESRDAMDILGADVWFLSIPDFLDDIVFRTILRSKFRRFADTEVVYAPNVDCSNRHHKAAGEVAKEIFDNVVFYDTYKDSWGTTGIGQKVTITNDEKQLKKRVMLWYKSQIEREQTRKHFREVWDEYITS